MRPPEELTIHGAGPQIARLLERLNGPLDGGWRRNTDAEARLTSLGLPAGRNHNFACTAEGQRPAAELWLDSRGDEVLSVDNIIPHGKRQLSEEEARRILADFDSQVIQPAGDGPEIRVELTPILETLEPHLSYDGLRRLKAFAASVDKSSPHPEDSPRWREFIIQAHLDGADFDSSLLDQWLAEAGWPEEQRQHLTHTYEDTQSILAAYDEERLEQCLR
jgi:hypothetical protein